MKKFIRGVLITVTAVILGLFSAVPSYALEAETVSVSGRGSLSVPADTVTIRFTVESRSQKEADARKKNDAAKEKLVGIAKAYGDIEAESYCFFEDTCGGYFVATRCLTLTSGMPGKAEEIIDKLIAGGASCVNGICYSLRNSEKYEKEALALALKDAETRADALGISMKMSEVYDFGSYCFGAWCGGADGTVTVECTVNIVYRKVF